MSRANEPAYPVKRDKEDSRIPDDFMFAGITLREHFAGLAMQGFMACDDPDRRDMQLTEMARLSVRAADALIAELEKSK